MKKILVFSFGVFFTPVFSQSILTLGTTTVAVDTVASNLDVPWEILYGSDDHLWITERKGLVSRIDPVNKTKKVILDLTAKVRASGESGMLGMAFHPDFPATPEVFIAYNYGMLSIYLRLVKYSYTGGALTNSIVLIDSIWGAGNHDGARLLFMPDKTLLLTTGDAGQSQLSQNMQSLNGKILRLNTNGSIPADNPYPNSYIYCLVTAILRASPMAHINTFIPQSMARTLMTSFRCLRRGAIMVGQTLKGFAIHRQSKRFVKQIM